MSNSSFFGEEKHPGMAENERGVPEPNRHRSLIQELPNPPKSNNASYDYSDVASVDSQNLASPRRRHKRGGRRGKRGGKLQSVSEFELPKGGQPEEQNILTDAEWKERTFYQNDYDAEELRKARSSRAASSKRGLSPRTSTSPDTGVKAFNVARAESSGGRRPVDITIERPNSTRTANGKENKKSDNRPEGEDESKEQDGETETLKPVSIRLDLNLEVEVFLRAKIKGDVTITFL
jgi:hypothetical protein